MNKKFRFAAAAAASVLAAAMFTGCADKTKNESSNQTSEEPLLEMPLEFGYNNNSGNNDLVAADPTKASGEEQSYVVVTDASGQPVTEYITVTEANGEPKTEFVEVTDANGEVVKDENGEPKTEVVNVTEAVEKTEPAEDSSYKPNIDSAYIMWADISKWEDYVFNDEFFAVTFKVKDTAKDGVYDIKITDGQFSCILNGGTTVVADNIMDGKVFVSTDAEAQPTVPDSGFSVYTDYVACKQGDEIVVRFSMKNNPGLVGMLIWFDYDKNALEIVKGKAAGDYADIANADFAKNPQSDE